MNTPLRFAIIGSALLAFSTASFAGPKLKIVPSVPILDAQFQVVCTLDDPAEIEPLIASFMRAEKIKEPPAQPAYSHKIDLEDRWLYDATRGEFTKLAHNKQPTYRLSEADRLKLNQLIAQAGSAKK
jgi:hypothetical protein